MTAPVLVGVSLKSYLGHAAAEEWMTSVAAIARKHPGVTTGRVELFVAPTYLQLASALALFRGTPVLIGAQDVSAFGPGAYTGEVTAAELVEIGVRVVEVGHAERRRIFGETEMIVDLKTRIALENGLVPVLCVGETDRTDPAGAADLVAAQVLAHLADAPSGPVIVAYEPGWAIGAAAPSSPDHIVAVCGRIRAELDGLPERLGSRVIYGGSAGPGLLTTLDRGVDGLFLGRFAHDPRNLAAVLDEAAARWARE